MELKRYGITRAQLRQGSQGPGGGNGDDHFQDMAGSRDFVIYLAPHKKLKGYAELKSFLEAQGCQVSLATDDRLLPGKGYQAVKVTHRGGLIPEVVLRRAHRWSHERNFIHRFFKPYPNVGT